MAQYPKQPPKFDRWWKNLKRKPLEQQREIVEKWLYYSCKTVANRADMDQARIVYTIATRYNKSKYKRISRSNAEKVYVIVSDKQYAHRKQCARINELETENQQLLDQLGRIYRTEQRAQRDTVIRRKKTRKIVTGGNAHVSS